MAHLVLCRCLRPAFWLLLAVGAFSLLGAGALSLLEWERSSVEAQTGAGLVFSTYLGGSGFDSARDVAVDFQGNIYVTGGTASPDFPTTPGAYDRTFARGGTSLGSGGPMDVFVAKFSPTGRLVWSTYLGGPNYDRAYAIEVDSEGFVYVGGRAGDGFPTTPGVLQPKFGGDLDFNALYGEQDGFVAKLSPDGSRLIWSTYFGSDDRGIFRDIAIDHTGNVFAVYPGAMRKNRHITPGALQTSKAAGEDMVVVKISRDAARVLYATYVGASGDDGGGPAIRVDSRGNAHIAAQTTSADMPTTRNAYQRTLRGTRDAYVAKLCPDGSSLLFGTYLGGSGQDAAGGAHVIAIDAQNNVYVRGWTTSTDFPVSAGAIQTSPGPGFIAKLSPDGSRLLASSYLPSGGEGIGTDADGDIYLSGGTESPRFPVTASAFQKTLKGSADAYVMKLSSDLRQVLYATYIGGRAGDGARSTPAAVFSDSEFVFVGDVSSKDLPVSNAFQAVTGGSGDTFAGKISLATATSPRGPEKTGSKRAERD